MAEEQNTEQEEKKPSSPLVKNGILFGLAMVVPMLIALAIFNFVIMPKVGDGAEEEDGPDIVDPFVATMTEVTFTEQQVSVRTEDPDMVAPLLIFQITLMCQDGATATLVETRKSLFTAMILQYHQGRTRSELNDPLVRNSILEQIKQQANVLLRRLQPEAELMVLEALHVKYTIVDL